MYLTVRSVNWDVDSKKRRGYPIVSASVYEEGGKKARIQENQEKETERCVDAITPNDRDS